MGFGGSEEKQHLDSQNRHVNQKKVPSSYHQTRPLILSKTATFHHNTTASIFSLLFAHQPHPHPPIKKQEKPQLVSIYNHTSHLWRPIHMRGPLVNRPTLHLRDAFVVPLFVCSRCGICVAWCWFSRDGGCEVGWWRCPGGRAPPARSRWPAVSGPMAVASTACLLPPSLPCQLPPLPV